MNNETKQTEANLDYAFNVILMCCGFCLLVETILEINKYFGVQ